MNNSEFDTWDQQVRDKLWYEIQNYLYKKGKYPAAILAGGEFVAAVYRDPEKRNSYMIKDMLVWHGVPFIRCGLNNKVVLVGNMEEIALPPVPAREGT